MTSWALILKGGDFYLTNFDANNHYEDNILRIEKYDPHKVWTAVLYDQDQNGYVYVKRFRLEATMRHQNYLGENPANQLILLTDTLYPRIKVTMGGVDDFREPIELDVHEYIGAQVEELEPANPVEDKTEEEDPDGENPIMDDDENLDPDAGKSQQDVADEMTGQLHLFDE